MFGTAESRALVFADRREAGRLLAQRLADYSGRDDVVVLALPRGGVPVGYEVARALGAPLDVFLVRKLELPSHEELAMGAIASGGVRVLNDEVIRFARVPPFEIDRVTRREEQELARRETFYRSDRRRIDVAGRIVILVDDGLATGSTMRAAVQALRAQHPARIVVAVPVGAAETCAALTAEADVVACARTPEPFAAVGRWYHDFSATTDAEVQQWLREGLERPAPGAGHA
jgi:putative phosphoribosyl transferase